MTLFRQMALALVLSAGPAAAQYVATTQAGVAYPALTNPQSVPLTAPNSVSDRGRATLTLPFTFQFYNRQYTALTVTANGVAFFEGSTNPAEDFPSNVAIPGITEPNGVLAPFWDDLDGSNGTSAMRQQVVTGSNGQGLAIEWKDWNRRFGMYTLTFQVRLWENGVIEYFYGTMQGSGQAISATIGLEAPNGATGTNALQASACINRVNPASPVPSFAHCDLSSFDPLNTGTPISYVRLGPPPGVDLQATRLRITGITQTGSDLQIGTEVTLRNFGTVGSAPFGYRLFLSSDTLYDPPLTDGGVGDVEISTAGLPPGPFTLPANGTLSNSTTGLAPRPTAGSFYVLAVVDEANVIFETNENNNVLATSTPIFAGVDLVAEGVSGPASAGPGDPVTISFTFSNQGFDPPGVVPYKFYLSPDTVFSSDDRLVFSTTRNVLGGENVLAQDTFTMPSTVAADDYYVLMQLDDGPAAGVVAEVSDANNQVFSRNRLQVRQADLVMDSVRVARPVLPYDTAVAAFFSEPIRLEATVRNQGGATAPNVSVVFFLSDNETLNGLTDPFICEVGPFTLAPREVRAVSQTCTVPSRSVTNQLLARGSYFFFAAAVAPGLAETNPGNNFVKGPPLLVRSPAPNLLPVNVQGPSRAGAGEVFAVTRTFTNNGNRPSTPVRYRYVVSANDIITRDDQILPIITMTGEVNERTVQLNVDQLDTLTELVRVPALLAPATYRLGVIIDPDRTIDEVSTDDNGFAGGPLEVVGQTLRLDPPFLPDGVFGQPYSVELSAGGTQAMATFSVKAPGELPPGITVSATGFLSGTPSRTGAYAFTVIVRTSTGQTTEVRRGLKISRPTASLFLSSPLLPAPARLLPYSYQLGVQGGLAPYTFTVREPLPLGLSMSERGLLSGTPTGALGTSSTFFVTVTDAVGNRDTRAYTLTVVDAAPFLVANVTLPNGVFGKDYLVDVVAQNAGGAPVSRPVQWRVLQGALPAGLALEDTVTERVIISGTPTSLGLFQFRLEATDAQGRADSVSYSIFIAASGLTIIGDVPRLVDRGAVFNAQLNPSAPIADSSFTLLDGQLPPGVSVSTSGAITGTVAEDAPYRSYTFTVGFGRSRDQLATLRTLRVDVEPPFVATRVGCSSMPGLELGAFLVLACAQRRRARRNAAALRG